MKEVGLHATTYMLYGDTADEVMSKEQKAHGLWARLRLMVM